MNILNKPIEMVAVFLPDGSVKPIRFRIKTEEESELVIKIASIKHINEEKQIDKTVMRKFICLIELNDIQRLCEIGYNLNSMKWTLFKM